MAQPPAIGSELVVVEIGASAAVASAGMVLADAGAHVTVVEPPGGSPLRALPAFSLWSRGKHSLELDLASDAGRATLLERLAAADVVLVGLKPASVDRLDVGYAALSANAPGLVYGSLTGFGQTGPYRDIPVYDAVMQARGGRMSEFGILFDGERPGFAAAPVVSHGAAMALLLGVFGALRERERNGGHGQLVETSLARAIGIYDLLSWPPGMEFPRVYQDSPFLAYSVARTQDGVWLQFAQNGPLLFADFLKALELDDELDAMELLSSQHADPKRAARARIHARVAERTWAEWQEQFAAYRNLSAERFHAPGEALRHPQFEAIGDVVEVEDPQLGTTLQLGPLFDIPARPLAPQGPAPSIGAYQPPPERSRRSPGAHTAAPGPGLLAGVTVLELGMWIALPYAGSQLADLGARVIKLEPLGGDPMRIVGPIGFKMTQDKQSLAIDLKAEGARAIVHKLVEQADVVIHSYRPGVPERLGIDFETLSKIQPELVYLYNGAYGSRGPKAPAPAFHVTGGAIAGGAWAQAGAGCPPPPDVVLSDEERLRIARRLERANEANPDFNSAVAAAAAVAMGLYARERGGKALAIETRMMLSNAMMMSQHFIDYEGRPAEREVDGDLHGLGATYRLYAAAEGWVFLAAPQPRDFERLCSTLDLAGLASDPRFATPDARAANDAALAEALGAAIAKHPSDALEARLTEAGVACVRADQGSVSEYLFGQDWARELGVVTEISDSLVGPYTRYGPAVQSASAAPLTGAFAPGADTRSLLTEIGLEPSEIDDLIAAGVVAQAAENA